MVQQNPNSNIKFSFIHKIRSFYILLNHKSFHFSSRRMLVVMQLCFVVNVYILKRLNQVLVLLCCNTCLLLLWIILSELWISLVLHFILYTSLLDKLFNFFDAVSNMNTFTSVQSSRFEDPNIFARIMAGWHNKWLARFQLKFSLAVRVVTSKNILKFLTVMKLQNLLFMSVEKFKNLLERFELC